VVLLIIFWLFDTICMQKPLVMEHRGNMLWQDSSQARQEKGNNG